MLYLVDQASATQPVESPLQLSLPSCVAFAAVILICSWTVMNSARVAGPCASLCFEVTVVEHADV